MHSSYDLNETKVGKANNPVRRYRQGRTFNRKLALYGAFFIRPGGHTAYNIETWLTQEIPHKRLTTNEDTDGEWYSSPAEEIKSLILHVLEEPIEWRWGQDLIYHFERPDQLALDLINWRV